MNEKKEVVDTATAARMLGVSIMTITRLIREGELCAYKLTLAQNSPYRIHIDSIEDFLERRQQPTR